ncbi:MAG TPA: serine hydrolase [Pyrinomonadaceae bacterium]|jgi:CubicO group peptidase (beta-lactamase class C family)|nr:serine hydrolase [Pyrinomonadaceae bacterium]
MKRLISLIFGLACVLTVTGNPVAAQNSGPINSRRQPQKASRLDRIRGVENSLSPYVPVAGRKGWNIRDRMKAYGVPGLSVAVIRDFRVDWAKGYGWADKSRRQPVTTKTMFSAGSISKPVAALAVMKLCEEGRIDLDRPVNDYLKSWRVPANDYTDKTPVTLRQLLSHTAGTTQHGFGGYAPGQVLPTVAQVLSGAPPAQSRAIVVNAEPGKEYRYSGGGVVAAQMAVMDVTGKPYAELLEETVFKPLGMLDSTFAQPLPAKFKRQAAWAYSDQPWFKGMPYVYPQAAAAGLYTTPADLARFVIELQKAHRGEGSKVIGQRTARTMLAAVKTNIEPGFYRTDIALGPFLFQRTDNEGTASGVYFNHSGLNAGFVANFFGSLEGGYGVVVMANQGEASELLKEIIRSVALVYRWPHYLPDEIKPARVPAEQLARYAGRYRKGEDEVLTFTVENDHLIEKGIDWKIGLEVYPVGGDQFAFTDYAVRGMFERDERGRARAFRFAGSDQKMLRMKDDEFAPSELLKMNRTEEAIEGFRKMKSGNENGLTYLAYTLVNGKPARPDQGLAVAKLACELYPQSPIAHFRAGEAYEKLGDEKQAALYYRKVLVLEAGNQDARERLHKLGALTKD